MNNNPSIIFTVVILFNTLLSCHSNRQNVWAANKAVEKFHTTERYPNQKKAYEKNGDRVLFYSPNKDHIVYAETNLKSRLLKINDINLFIADDLQEISRFDYFSPKSYSTFYKYPIGESGTAGGNFATSFELNEIGLIKSVEKNLPESKSKYLYSYNKYGQILKIVEEGLWNKVVLENKYDEQCRLVFQKKNDQVLQVERALFYNGNDKIEKEDIKEKEVAPNGKILKDETYSLHYQYNTKGQLIRKYTKDENHSFEYQYDLLNHKLISVVEYVGVLDNLDPKKLINHIIKRTFGYRDDWIVEETCYSYNIVNVSILIDKKWQAQSIARQRELAWQKLKDQSQLPLSGIEKKYFYPSNEFNVTVNKYKFFNTISNGETIQNKELIDSEIIKYKLDNIGRITKKEIHSKNKKTEEVQEFLY